MKSAKEECLGFDVDYGMTKELLDLGKLESHEWGRFWELQQIGSGVQVVDVQCRLKDD